MKPTIIISSSDYSYSDNDNDNYTPNLKKDFLTVLPKIESMNAEDCRLFYESFQNILKEGSCKNI